MTEKSLFAFLERTRLPLFHHLRGLVQSVTVALAIGTLAFGLFVLIKDGLPLWDASRPWSGALPLFVAFPPFLAGTWFAHKGSMSRGALGLFLGLLVLSLMALIPRGPSSTGWFVQPVLLVAATACLGIFPGLLMTLGASAGLWISWSWVPHEMPLGSVLGIIAVLLTSGLVGVLVHGIVGEALWTEESHRARVRDTRRALRYRERLLRHALRVETVGDIASLVVHQLRNHSQVMMGHLALARHDEGERKEERLEAITEILHEERPLLDHLLELAHPEDGETRTEDLSQLAHEFCRKSSMVLPASVRVEVAIDPEPLPVRVDSRGLDHALWNLVINAKQAMSEESGILRIDAGQQDNKAWLSVEDNGCGITPADAAKIFEPYFTTKPLGTGTGLGLTAVSRFVRGVGGTVEVDSAVDEGTRFTLWFPLVEASDPIEPPAEAHAG